MGDIFGFGSIIEAGINSISQVISTNRKIKSAERIAKWQVKQHESIAEKSHRLQEWKLDLQRELFHAQKEVRKHSVNKIMETHKSVEDKKINAEWRMKRGLNPNKGKFLIEKMPRAYDPIILFDIGWYQEEINNSNQELLGYNPIMTLYSLFNKQNIRLGGIADVYDVNLGFTTRTAAQQFCLEEFKGHSFIFVYGRFSGTRFEVFAVYNGISIDQFIIDQKEDDFGVHFKVNPHTIKHVSLGDFQRSTFKQITPTTRDHHKADENIELVFDCFINSTIQALVDQRFALISEEGYIPKAGKIFEEKFKILKSKHFFEGEELDFSEKVDELSSQIRQISSSINKLESELLEFAVINELFN